MMVDSYDLLDMKLADISDLLLQRLCESGNDHIQVELPGCDVKNRERFVLTVSLRKDEVE